MPNTLGYYNPLFYANEALIQLEKALGMAGRVYRGYEEERRRYGRGDTINIRRPGTFTAQNAPSSAQDLLPESVQIVLSNWKEVKFGLTDKELAYTSERIIEEHIRPAAVALADDIDRALCLLYRDVPWHYTTTASPGSDVKDLTGPHRTLFDNRVPMQDPSMLHFMVDGEMQLNLLSNSAFSQWQGAGTQGVQTQMSGALGQRFGMNFFANQNVQNHTTTPITVTSPTVSATAPVGATTISLQGTTLSGTLKAGDVLTFTGFTQRYAVTADATAVGNAVTVSITPAIQVQIPSGTVWSALQAAVDGPQRLAFHRNAFALVLAPLPETGQDLGARIATVTDPITGLSIRSRIFYEGNNSKVFVALDVLYGVRTLDPNLAVRVVI